MRRCSGKHIGNRKCCLQEDRWTIEKIILQNSDLEEVDEEKEEEEDEDETEEIGEMKMMLMMKLMMIRRRRSIRKSNHGMF